MSEAAEESRGEMPFLSHLDELRNALLWAGAALIILSIPAMYYSDLLLDGLIRAGCPPKLKLQYFSPLEPLMVQLKVACFAALAAALPVIFWRLWRFAAPGLFGHERQLLLRMTLISTALFLAGAAAALFLAVPLMMNFGMSFQTDQMQAMLGLQNYVGLCGWLMLGFGAMFQFPVAVYLLVAAGLVRVATLRKQRPVIVVIILILAAILTPPDVVSQLMLGVPAWLMFEISLVLAAITEKRRDRVRGEAPADADEPETAPEPSAKDTPAAPPVSPDVVDDAGWQLPPDTPTGSSRYHRAYDERQNRRRVRFVGGAKKPFKSNRNSKQ